MSAATATARYLLAQAAIRSDAIMHVVSQRDSGALNPVCGAHPVRSREINTWTAVPAVLAALCSDCAALAAGIPGVESIEEGLAVFVGGGPQRLAASRLLELPLDVIVSATEPRRPGAGLVAAVKRNGVVTPITVRRVGRGLALVDGGRRIAAARAAGLTTIPAIVRSVDEQQAVVEQLLANLHHEDLDPIAQALAYVAALDRLGISQTALADGLGISRPAVTNAIRLLQLPEHLRAHVADGTLRVGQARALLECDTEEEQDALADQFIAGRATKGARKRQDEQDQELARIVATYLTVKRVQIKPVADGKQIVLTVTDAELPSILAQFQRAA